MNEIKEEQLRDYTEDGFVTTRQFIDAEPLARIVANVDRFIDDVVPTMPPEHVFYEELGNPSTLKQLQQMGRYDPWFHQQFTSGPFRELAEHLLDGPVVPKNLQYFNKPPGVSQPTPPHQDGYYFKLAPCQALTMWLALEDVDEETGCVCYVRGSHRHGMREHGRTQTLGFSQGIVDYPQPDDTACEVAIPAGAGDLLAHDAMTIHRADGNRSATRTRRALGFIYYSERAREDQAAHEAYERKLTQELRDSGKI